MQSAFQILKLCNYIVIYNNSQINTAVISANLKNENLYQVKWLPETKTLVSNWKNISLELPQYTVPTIVQLILKDICTYYEYPYRRVDFQYQGNSGNNLLFKMDMLPEECEKAENFNLLVNDLVENGLSRQHIELVKDMNIIEGFEKTINYLYDVEIKINEKKETNPVCE